jgi:hypothetical protein
MTPLDEILKRVEAIKAVDMVRVMHFEEAERAVDIGKQLAQDVEALVEHCKFLDDCVGINRRMFERRGYVLDDCRKDNAKLREALEKITNEYKDSLLSEYGTTKDPNPHLADKTYIKAKEALSTPSPAQENTIQELISKQKPLDTDFQKILDDNSEALYEKTDPEELTTIKGTPITREEYPKLWEYVKENFGREPEGKFVIPNPDPRDEEIKRLREASQAFLSVIATCNQINTPEWMEYLAEQANEFGSVIGIDERLCVNKRGNIGFVETAALGQTEGKDE